MSGKLTGTEQEFYDAIMEGGYKVIGDSNLQISGNVEILKNILLKIKGGLRLDGVIEGEVVVKPDHIEVNPKSHTYMDDKKT